MEGLNAHDVDHVQLALRAKLDKRNWIIRRGLGYGKDRCEKK